jgi:hypothetical protein
MAEKQKINEVQVNMQLIANEFGQDRVKMIALKQENARLQKELDEANKQLNDIVTNKKE